jgi:hypothetical protein
MLLLYSEVDLPAESGLLWQIQRHGEGDMLGCRDGKLGSRGPGQGRAPCSGPGREPRHSGWFGGGRGAGWSSDGGRGAGGVVRRLSCSGVLMLFLGKKIVTEPIVSTTPDPQVRRHSSTPGMPLTNMRLLLSSTRWRLQVTGVGAEGWEDRPRAPSCQSLSRSVTSDSQGGSEASSIESMNT